MDQSVTFCKRVYTSPTGKGFCEGTLCNLYQTTEINVFVYKPQQLVCNGFPQIHINKMNKMTICEFESEVGSNVTKYILSEQSTIPCLSAIAKHILLAFVFMSFVIGGSNNVLRNFLCLQ